MPYACAGGSACSAECDICAALAAEEASEFDSSHSPGFGIPWHVYGARVSELTGRTRDRDSDSAPSDDGRGVAGNASLASIGCGLFGQARTQNGRSLEVLGEMRCIW